MKKYLIKYEFFADAYAEVLANDEKEAREKARDIEFSLQDYHFETEYEDVESVEEVPDLPELIQRCEAILKNNQELSLLEWPEITTEVWNGDEMKKKKSLSELVYFNDEDDEEIELTEKELEQITLEEGTLAEKIREAVEDDASSQGCDDNAFLEFKVIVSNELFESYLGEQ